MMRAAAAAMSVAATACAAWSQAPPVSIPEHSYPAGSVTTLITYTCKDGGRSISLQKGQFVKARVASLSRNEIVAPPWVIERVNRLLDQLDAVRAIHPECHSKADILFVEGLKNREERLLPISWSPDEPQPER